MRDRDRFEFGFGRDGFGLGDRQAGRRGDGRNHDIFGDYSANDQTRKAVLERLLSLLEIAPQCSLSDKF